MLWIIHTAQKWPPQKQMYILQPNQIRCAVDLNPQVSFYIQPCCIQSQEVITAEAHLRYVFKYRHVTINK